MARTAITPQPITVLGTATPQEAANVDGNSVRLSSPPRQVLWVKNGSGGSINVTLQTPGTSAGLAIADRVVAVAAGADRFIALDEVLRRGEDDFAYVDYSAVTTVTVTVLTI